jgi:hypothetical protein
MAATADIRLGRQPERNQDSRSINKSSPAGPNARPSWGILSGGAKEGVPQEIIMMSKSML